MRNYTDDIRRYHSGEMTPEERYALEREALNDPFLADALEGAEELPAEDFAKDVAHLNRRVKQHIHHHRKVWWQQPVRTAAAVLMLALATFGIIYIWPERNQEPLALKQPGQEKMMTTEGPPAGSDSLQVSAGEKVLQQAAGQKQEETRQRLSDVPMPDKADHKLALAEEPAAKENVEQVNTEEVELAAAEKAARTQQPAVTAPVMALRSEAAKDVGMDRISEIVVAGQKKNIPGFTPAYPEGGLEIYQHYLEQSLQYPSEALKHKTEGTVMVEFVVEPDGSISSLKIIRGIGQGCEEELVRLVREGARWVPAMQYNTPVRDTVQVKLRFKLPK